MTERFWIAAVVFHLGIGMVSVIIGRGWARRLGQPRPTPWFGSLVRDAVSWGASALVLAAGGGLFTSNGFTILRLLCQALFGEMVVLTAWLTALFWRRRWRPVAFLSALACSSLLAIYAEAYHHEPTDLHVRRHDVDLSHGHAARGRCRILQLSDIQADHVGPYEERAIRTAMDQGTDLIVMTGDYVQPRLGATRPEATATLNQLLRRLGFGARLGAFAVRGDVDVDWPRVFEGTAVTPLSGEVARLALPDGTILGLIGVTSGMSHGRDAEQLLRLVNQTPPDALRIVIGHGPDFVMNLAGKAHVDLAMAGHTHGGQVILPFLGAPFTKSHLPRRYASGFQPYEEIPLSVSAGIGMERGTAPQIRFLCPPEMTVLEVTY